CRRQELAGVGVHVLAPGDVRRAGDVPGLLRLFLREVRRREQLAAELFRRTDVDQALATLAENVVLDVVAEGADLVVGLGDLIAARRNDLRGVFRQLAPFQLPLLPATVEQLR